MDCLTLREHIWLAFVGSLSGSEPLKCRAIVGSAEGDVDVNLLVTVGRFCQDNGQRAS
jgi:hypothetical protein